MGKIFFNNHMVVLLPPLLSNYPWHTISSEPHDYPAAKDYNRHQKKKIQVSAQYMVGC